MGMLLGYTEYFYFVFHYKRKIAYDLFKICKKPYELKISNRVLLLSKQNYPPFHIKLGCKEWSGMEKGSSIKEKISRAE